MEASVFLCFLYFLVFQKIQHVFVKSFNYMSSI